MHCRAGWTKLCGILMSTAILYYTAPISLAEISDPDPLGSILSTGKAFVGNATAPDGTTVFAGDRVRSEGPALISLNGGSRIEMTRAAADFDRKGDAFFLRADEGLFRFRFKNDSKIEIEAGEYLFTGVGKSDLTGELGVNRRGQIAMNLITGAFEVLNTLSGERMEVSVATPFAAMDQTGRGRVVNNGKTIVDDSLSSETDALKGQCVVIDAEAYAISGNSGNLITVSGNWELKSGEYAYHVVACTEAAMVRAGASRDAAKKAVVASVFGVPPVAPASHTARNAAIIAGVAGAAALPLALKAMKKDEKSPSSR